jgi:hypothetical protein
MGKSHREGLSPDGELQRLLVAECRPTVERDLQLIASLERRVPVADVDALVRRRIQVRHEQQTASEDDLKAPEWMTCVHLHYRLSSHETEAEGGELPARVLGARSNRVAATSFKAQPVEEIP